MGIKVLGCDEVRKAYFLAGFDREVEPMRIISMGKCNYNCSYCKRGGQFRDCSGNIINSKNIDITDIFEIIDLAISRGQKIRLSGGDPCCYPKESRLIAKYCYEKHGQLISIAHNGSSPTFVNSIVEYLDYAAIDLKGCTDMEIAKTASIPVSNYIEKIIDIIKICQLHNVLVDIRTVVFPDSNISDLIKTGELLKKYNNVFWTLRKFVDDNTNTSSTNFDIVEVCEIVKNSHPTLKVGCRDKWTGTNFHIPIR